MNKKEEKVIISNFLKKLLVTENIPEKENGDLKIQITEEPIDIKSMKNIKKLFDNYNWNLGVCEYRYGNGVFAFVVPSIDHAQCFDELASKAGDIAATDFYFYVTGVGKWLPIVYASTLEAGLHRLNEKLDRPITPEWRTKVRKAYDIIGEVTDNSYSLSNRVNAKMIELMG